MEYLVGTGGWAYFHTRKKPQLKAYSESFNFTEVNCTFYEYPQPRTVERWRRAVPPDFTFTVRCHQDLTHKIGLRPVDEAYAVFSKMLSICQVLHAPVLHLLTPALQVLDKEKLKQTDDFLSTINTKGIRLAWEARSPMSEELTSLMQDYGIIHSVDLSRENPTYNTDILYTRLFGRGKHNIYQFTDQELEEIEHKAVKCEAKMIMVVFHGLRMSTDASRFKKHVETGQFLPVTAYTGVESARAVLAEDAKFPSTKAELVEHQGWKIIDFTASERVHLSDLLSKLPDRTYNGIWDVVTELEALK
jgi:uncharacterized protein YecE (DUF72 family)